EDLSAKAPPRLSAALQRLINSREEMRQTARYELKKILVKNHLKELGDRFEAAITSVADHESTTSGAVDEPPYMDIARTIIGDRLDELEHLGNSLFSPDDSEQLHEMRIAAKRLRYAIELFADCWKSDIESFAKEAAHLQTDLGQLHDC